MEVLIQEVGLYTHFLFSTQQCLKQIKLFNLWKIHILINQGLLYELLFIRRRQNMSSIYYVPINAY